MRFIFDKLSIMIIVGIFLAFAMFGFIMNFEDSEDFYGNSFDPKENEPDDITQITLNDKDLLTIPGASLPKAHVDGGDLMGEFTFWEAHDLWDEFSLSVPWFHIDFNFGKIFPNLNSAYSMISTEISSAPYIFQIMIYAIPLVLLFVVLRSLEVGI